MKPTKIFVYGTLKKGHALNPELEDSKCLGDAVLKGYEIYSNGYYPMIKKSKDANALVVGEVYEITDAGVLARLDLIESAYERVPVEVKLKGELVEAETYVYSYKLKYETRIMGGVWN